MGAAERSGARPRRLPHAQRAQRQADEWRLDGGPVGGRAGAASRRRRRRRPPPPSPCTAPRSWSTRPCAALLEQLSGTPEPEEARRRFCAWEDQLREEQQRAIADLWRKAGRFLVGPGSGADQGYGDATWRRLYLTEVAPWADYAEGDETGSSDWRGQSAPPRAPAVD